MSRSFKHRGILQDQSSKKYGKRFANKRVRRYNNEIQSGSNYKKIYNSWDIVDYKLYARGKLLIRYHQVGRKFKIIGYKELVDDWVYLDRNNKYSLWKDWSK